MAIFCWENAFSNLSTYMLHTHSFNLPVRTPQRNQASFGHLTRRVISQIARRNGGVHHSALPFAASLYRRGAPVPFKREREVERSRLREVVFKMRAAANSVERGFTMIGHFRIWCPTFAISVASLQESSLISKSLQ